VNRHDSTDPSRTEVARAYAHIARACGAQRAPLGEADADAWFAHASNRILAEGVRVRRVRGNFLFRFRRHWSELQLGDAFPVSPAAALHLRHAFEWRALVLAADAPVSQPLLQALALVTACLFVRAEPAARAAAIRAASSVAQQRVLDCSGVLDAGAGTMPALAGALGDLTGMSFPDARTLQRNLERAGALLLPGEVLLTLGGDGRLRLDRELRLNKYGCSPMPRPEAITFASCTATSVSDLAFLRAETVRRKLLLHALAEGLVEAAKMRAHALRNRIHQELSLTPGTALVLAPSGTDCELLLTGLALATGRTSVLHVAVGFDEAGSGTTAAARGRHFDVLTPRGDAVARDTPIEGMFGGEVVVHHVALRSADGAVRSLSDIDASVRTVVQDGLAQGRHVVLHAMDSSKTGLGGPSLELARTLQGGARGRVWVVVDAAQMRVSRETLSRYQNAGCMVVLTGSKFFTGPPFAGALAIPAALARQFDTVGPLAHGVGDYFSRTDLPECWAHWLAAGRMACNPGLLLRWEASLAEIEAFHAVPDAARRDYFARFHDGVLGLFQGFPRLRPVVSDSFHETARAVHEDWDCVQTIFPFLALRANARALDMEEALRLYHCLNSDLSGQLRGRLRGRARALAARQCHIGQPVALPRRAGAAAGALRIAPGARFVARVHFDPLLGRHPRERLARQLDDVQVVMHKAELILEHWDALPDVKPRPSLDTHPPVEVLA